MSVGPILLAGDAKEFPRSLLEEAARLARVHGTTVYVLQLMRIWGTGLGVPHPGLMPNKQEKEVALQTVRDATAYFAKHHVAIDQHRITATRNPVKTILREAKRIDAERIVMVRAPKGRLRPVIATDYGRITRRAHVPVDLIDVA